MAIGHDSELGKQSGQTSQGRAGQSHLAQDFFVGGFLALVPNCVKLGWFYISLHRELWRIDAGLLKRLIKSALQRISFRYIILAQCKILVPTNQALQYLMPNAVLAILFLCMERGEKQLPRKSCVLWGSCLVQARRRGHEVWDPSSASWHGTTCLGHTRQMIAPDTYTYPIKSWSTAEPFPLCSSLLVRECSPKSYLP